ncbi:MAG: hypothetical protein ACREDH_04955 [Methylocella sp.]
MRKVGRSRTLKEKPTDQIVDLATRWGNFVTPRIALKRDGTPG